jgi:protein JSN1
MHEERVPNKSIWQHERAGSPGNSVPFPSVTPAAAPANTTPTTAGRSRAGTLPSRLSPGLKIPTQQTSFVNSSSTSLGSLALLSPDKPSPIGSPSVMAGATTQNTSTSLEVPSASSRLRSGSLNVLSENQPPQPKFSPFGPSIWASPNDTSSAANNAATTPNNESSVDDPPVDPMQPFLNELSLKTDVNRLRSYTVNTLPYGLDDPQPHPQQQQQQQPQPQQQQHLQPQQHLHPQQQHHPIYEQQQQQQQQQHLHVPNLMTTTTPNRPRAQTAAAAFDFPPTTAASSLSRSLSYKPSNQRLPTVDGGSSMDDSQVGASRSLWLGNIPSSTTSYSLQAIFSTYGPIESARVLTHKNCGFIDFLSVESAIHAKSVLNGKELFAGSGPCRVRFAKSIPASERTDDAEYDSSSNNNNNNNNSNSNNSGGVEYAVTDKEGSQEQVQTEPIRDLSEIQNDMVQIVGDLGADEQEIGWTRESIRRALDFNEFESEIPLVPEPSPDRVYDAPTLREVRKKVDSGQCSQEEVEEIAVDLLDEIAELSSDYVGNTVVQKLFDTCSEPIKELMLDQIAPYLAQIGIHKNGTWAAQKIIDVAGTSRQYDLISQSLRPYTVHLFLDQFGNYVIQCCLKYGSPWNDFIFETMLSRFWDIAQGRFGARAMRACLESHYATRDQQRMLAAAITLHAVQLATNANGALLLTWFLDTCTLPNRHSILAPRLIPNLVQLCTHKLACLTVLKVINHKADPVARRSIFDALFTPNEEAPGHILEQILSDNMYGPTFIYKVISTPFLEYAERQNAVNKIRNVLISIKALPSQGYKRLMDEVGLATRTSSQRNGNGSNPQGTPQNSTNSNNNNSSYPMKPRTSRGNSQNGGTPGSNNGNNGGRQSQSPQKPFPKMSPGVQPTQPAYFGGPPPPPPSAAAAAPPPPPPQMFAQFGNAPPPPTSQYDMGMVQQQFDQMALNDPMSQYRGAPPPPMMSSQPQQQAPPLQQHQQIPTAGAENEMVYMRMPEQGSGPNPVYMAGPMGYPQFPVYEQPGVRRE